MKLLRLFVASIAAWMMCQGMHAHSAYAEEEVTHTETVVQNEPLESLLNTTHSVSIPGFNSALGRLYRIKVEVTIEKLYMWGWLMPWVCISVGALYPKVSYVKSQVNWDVGYSIKNAEGSDVMCGKKRCNVSSDSVDSVEIQAWDKLPPSSTENMSPRLSVYDKVPVYFMYAPGCPWSEYKNETCGARHESIWTIEGTRQSENAFKNSFLFNIGAPGNSLLVEPWLVEPLNHSYDVVGCMGAREQQPDAPPYPDYRIYGDLIVKVRYFYQPAPEPTPLPKLSPIYPLLLE
jgi:hypothetical protein